MALTTQLLEEFALLQDQSVREAYLARLTPGTQEHFLCAWLCAEQASPPFPERLVKLLDVWVNNNPYSDLSEHYKNRRKFIEGVKDAGSDSKEEELNEDIKAWLTDKLSLYFYHSQESIDGSTKDTLPSVLPEATLKELTEDALVEATLKRMSNSDSVFSRLASPAGTLDHPLVLKKFVDSQEFAYQYIAAGGLPHSLDDATLCNVLSKLYNDNTIRNQYSYQFEAKFTEKVFPQATLAQLQRLGGVGKYASNSDACKKFRESSHWAGAVVARMAPQRTVDFRSDRDAKVSYLLALKEFCEGMPPSFNPLRHVVLYHLLDDARTRLGRKAFSFSFTDAAADEEAGKYRALLLEFVKLPRSSYQATSTWLRSEEKGLSFWKDVLQVMNIAGQNAPEYGIVNTESQSARSRDLLKSFALPLPTNSQDDSLIVNALSDIFASAAFNTSGGAGVGGDGDEDRNGGLSPWSPYMSGEWLRKIQAEARLTRGSPEDRGVAAAKWSGSLASYSSACQSMLQSLKDKVELALSSWNREYFSTTDPVSVSLVAKGVQSLDVRVFEIATTSYYSEKLSEVPSDLALDGLHAHEAFTVDVASAAEGPAEEPWNPLRRYDLNLSFDSLKPKSANTPQRGVFVIEVTGGGVSVRAVIRKGSLRIVERKTVSGHILHVLGEDNTPLDPAKVSVTLAGRKYTPAGSAAIAGSTGNNAGSGILIPYGASPSRQPLIITLAGDGGDGDGDWSFSTLQPGWQHLSESYTLEASFAIERETLIKDNYDAKIVVRPRLLLHGTTPAPLGTLVNVSLTLTSTDADGSSSTKLIKPFNLANAKESVASFPVPPGLRRLRAKLSGDYENMSNGERVTVNAEHDVSLNQIDSSDATRSMFLRQTADGGYAIYCLGKSGEPVPNQRLNITLVERVTTGYYSQGPTVTLGTDNEGKVILGKLPPTIKLITVNGMTTQASIANASVSPGTTTAYFELPQEVLTYDPQVHTVAPPPGASAADATPQVALPFRPSKFPYSATVDPRDISVVEVRPTPAQERSIACGGEGGIDSESSSLVVRDVLKEDDAKKYVRYDSALGYLVVQNLPAGEYRVRVLRPYPGCPQPGRVVKVVVLPYETAQVVGSGWLASGSTLLQLKGTAGAAAEGVPVNISSCNGSAGDDHLTVRVSGGSKGLGPATASDVRLHVSAATFVPAMAADIGLSLARNLSLSGLASSRYGPTRSRYLDSRVLGEETRYVLERQKLLAGPADKQPLPGNALPRPSMLLNPWSLGPADSGTQDAKGGTSYASHADATASRAVGGAAASSGVGAGDGNAASFASLGNLDFLASPARVLTNLAVGATNGEVKISVKDLLAAAANAASAGSGNVTSLYLTLVAADSSSTASTHCCVYADSATGKIVAVTAAAFPRVEARDLSVSRTGIAADDHVVQSSRITMLAPPDGSVVVSASATNTKIESFGSIDRVFALFAAQSSNAQLTADWSFLMSWPVLSMTEKKSRYSKNACHELHLFLFFHDYDFFNTVVRPFISCKRAKTFIDHWLLGHDMTPYTTVNAFQRLNALEKALLAARVADSANGGGQGAALRKAIAEELKAVVENSPLNPSQKESIFKAALASSGLDSTGPQGGAALQALLKRADAEKAAAMEASMAAKRAAAVQQQAAPKPQAQAIHALNEMPMQRSVMARRGAGPSAAGGGGMPFASKAMAAPSMSMAAPPPPGAAMMMSRSSLAAPTAASMRDEASFYASSASGLMMDEEAVAYPESEKKVKAKKKSAGGIGGLLGGMAMRKKEMAKGRRSSDVSECDDDDEAEGGAPWDRKDMDEEEESDGGLDEGDIDDADLALRSQARDNALFRPLPKTEEFAEAQYYKVLQSEDTADLVTVNEFIADFGEYCSKIGTVACRLGGGCNHLKPGSSGVDDPVAQAIKQTPFASPNIGVVAASGLPVRFPVRDSSMSSPSSGRFLLNQMLLALAVTGLPFDSSPDNAPAAPNVSLLPNGGGLKFASGGSPLVVFHQDLSAVSATASRSTGAGDAAAGPGAGSVILCGQSYYDPLDKDETIRGQTREKFLKPSTSSSSSSGYSTFSMLRGKVYGAAVVVTNVSSNDQNIDILCHLPQGAMPVSNHKVLKTTTMRLSPFSTRRIDYCFYFPHVATYDHYPVHVSTTSDDAAAEGGNSNKLLAYASPTSIRVVEGNDADSIDTTSWAWISQMGTLEEVLAYIAKCNVKQTDWSKILWRCNEETPEVWFAIVEALKARHVFDENVWSYGMKHGVSWAVKEYLRFPDVQSRIAHYFGPLPLLVSPLITTAGEAWAAGGDAGSEDAPASDSAAAIGSLLQANRDNYVNLGDGAQPGDVTNYYYNHLEYSPLVNARAHVLGEKRTIVNRAVLRQWRNLLAVLASKRPADITPADDLAVVYFLLLLDRVPEARTRFATIKAPADSVSARFGTTRGAGATTSSSTTSNKDNFMTLQHDYCAAYLDLFNGPIESEEPLTDTDKVFPIASAVAKAYKSYPVPKWAAKFREIGSLLATIAAMATPGALSPAAADVHGSAALGSGLSAEEVGLSKELTREQQNTLAAAMEPVLGLKTRGSNLVVSYNRALGKKVNVAAYAMDVELLFSNAPFSIGGGADNKKSSSTASSLGAFAFVRPNSVIRIGLNDDADASAGGGGDASRPFAAPSKEVVCPLPPKLAKKNLLLVGSSAAHPSLRAVQPYFANELSVTLSEAFGRVKICHSGTGAALPRVYVKVYYRSNDDDTKGRFYKDGYSSASGTFDYAALSTDELSSGKVKKFAILVASEEYGSQVLLANPPKV